jgi:hypothetical protein
LVVYASLFIRRPPATLAMIDDTTAAFSFPAVARKKVTGAFDGGRITSEGGVMLSVAERRLGIAERLSRCFPDRSDPRPHFCDRLRLRGRR